MHKIQEVTIFKSVRSVKPCWKSATVKRDPTIARCRVFQRHLQSSGASTLHFLIESSNFLVYKRTFGESRHSLASF